MISPGSLVKLVASTMGVRPDFVSLYTWPPALASVCGSLYSHNVGIVVATRRSENTGKLWLFVLTGDNQLGWVRQDLVAELIHWQGDNNERQRTQV